MTLNGEGTIHRTADDEDEDTRQVICNYRAEAWKDWPNEAAFDNLTEHRGPLPLKVRGRIPGYAAGALYRTGPGQSSLETSRGKHLVSHWFDGFAHTHRFDIVAGDDGREMTVTYSSRRQSEALVEQVRRQGWRSATSFGQRADPCMGLFAKVMSVFEPSSGNHNVTVQAAVPGLSAARGHGPALCIGTDYASLRRIDPASLEPLGRAMQTALHPALRGVMSCAHAQRDAASGDYFNYNLEFGRVATYRVFRVDAASGRTHILATVALPDVKPAYLHSFFLTPRFVVLCIPSTHFAWAGLKIPWERNVLDAIEPFDPARRCQWLVVDRLHAKGLVARFSTPAGFFFHSVNAFEESVGDRDGHEAIVVCCDAVMYDNFDIIRSFYYDVILDRDEAMRKHWLRDGRVGRSSARLARFRFRMPSSSLSSPPDAPPVTVTATEELRIPSPHVGELPAINAAYAGRAYRYVYSTPSRGLSTVVDALAKTDTRTRTAVLWSGPPGHSPGEPVFVARPGAADEDDGVVLSVVVDGVTGTTYLLCLDARSMRELGRAEADFAVGMGFHGIHTPARMPEE